MHRLEINQGDRRDESLIYRSLFSLGLRLPNIAPFSFSLPPPPSLCLCLSLFLSLHLTLLLSTYLSTSLFIFSHFHVLPFLIPHRFSYFHHPYSFTHFSHYCSTSDLFKFENRLFANGGIHGQEKGLKPGLYIVWIRGMLKKTTPH